jgi:recombination protein RecT
MAVQVPAVSKVATIRELLQKSRRQMEMTLPKHLTADRLMRVAMTSIQKTPKLLECTPQSLLACVMTCAQLGLEPDQFLGQAYLVPFGNVCTLIPGYRGYIALARRSGEMQTVSAQVVHENDDFELQYGIEDKLNHKPALNGDRGKAIGAYCVFKYKDGGYSFDFLPLEEIEKVRARSKAAGSGPWVTDWEEMAKKTVIKRHAKLAPLSVEFQRAVALEDRANLGESQADLLGMDDDVIEAESAPDPDAFIKSIPKGTDVASLNSFIAATAAANKSTQGEVEADAVKDPKNFWKFYGAWAKQQAAKKQAGVKAPIENMMAPGDCPNNEGTTYTKAHCDGCPDLKGCPVWI